MPKKPKIYVCMGFYLFGITKEQIERPMKQNLKDLDEKQLPTTNI